jgi:hypothetical protein
MIKERRVLRWRNTEKKIVCGSPGEKAEWDAGMLDKYGGKFSLLGLEDQKTKMSQCPPPP